MTTPQVTILVPNYKTLDLTKLCLRLIRKHTDPSLAKVLVIDNDSQDESLDYLRTLPWIELIERKHVPGEMPALCHSRALDLALEKVTTPYVLSIHTDTLVRNKAWLPYILSHIENAPDVGGVGSWKIEPKPLWKRILKKIERTFQILYYKLIGKKNHAIEGIDGNYYYLRSHCALYRTDLIRQYQTGFSDGEEVAGKVMHRKLADHGHKMIFLSADELIKYIDHINHATMILHPDMSKQIRNVDAGLRRVQESLDSFHASDILKDESLDR